MSPKQARTNRPEKLFLKMHQSENATTFTFFPSRPARHKTFFSPNTASILDWLQLMGALLSSRKHCFLLDAAHPETGLLKIHSSRGGGVKLSTSVLPAEKTCACVSWAQVLFYIMSLTSTTTKKTSTKTRTKKSFSSEPLWSPFDASPWIRWRHEVRFH